MPEIMIEPAVREAFACFLERLSEKDSNLAGDLLGHFTEFLSRFGPSDSSAGLATRPAGGD
jgi:hypothetical protein